MDSVDEGENYVMITMSHTLISGVLQKRELFWLKPNIIVLLDMAESETERKYTQNFILQDFRYNAKDKNRVAVDVAPKFTLTVTQYPAGSDFELISYNGTADMNDTEHYRGSLVTGRSRLRKGLNLAYIKTGSKAEFITVLEAHSGKSEEISVKNVTFKDGVLTVEKKDGEKMKWEGEAR
jgi:hypothetical protein